MKTKYHLLTQFIKYISILLLILLPTIVTAGTILSINDKEASYTDFKVKYFIEADGQFLDIDDIQKVTFKETISNKISLGYSNNEIWFHVNIHNNTSSDRNMVLEFTEVFHDVVDLYVVSEQTTYKKNGLVVPVHKREIQEANPSFLLTFKAEESKDIYLKISSKYGIMGTIQLKNEEIFYKDIQIKKYLYLAYIVSLITIILYTLIYFLYFKEKVYFYYIMYILLFSMWVAIVKGITLTFISIELFHTFQLIIPILFIVLILFSQAILETEKKHVKLHKIFNITIYMSIITIIGMILSPINGFYFMNIISVPLLLTTLALSIWFLNKKRILIKIYLLGFSIYSIGMVILAIVTLGYLPYSHFISHLIIFISIVTVILFSLLLTYRINLLRRESLESREELLEQQKSESTRLFHSVSEKTKELNLAKKEIEEELRKKIELEKHLQHLASTDPMTELYNRRAFFDISDLEVGSAKSSQGNLACLVIDIDHFKKVNDTYGHDIGDKVITVVSKLMILNTRTKDHIGRIGGEEFAVIMPKTDAEAAYQIADRLRENISQHGISFNHNDSEVTIKVTVSIGLSYLSDENENIHTLLKRADTALYEAKNNGRNQVCCLPTENSEES